MELLDVDWKRIAVVTAGGGALYLLLAKRTGVGFNALFLVLPLVGFAAGFVADGTTDPVYESMWTGIAYAVVALAVIPAAIVLFSTGVSQSYENRAVAWMMFLVFILPPIFGIMGAITGWIGYRISP